MSADSLDLEFKGSRRRSKGVGIMI